MTKEGGQEEKGGRKGEEIRKEMRRSDREEYTKKRKGEK